MMRMRGIFEGWVERLTAGKFFLCGVLFLLIIYGPFVSNGFMLDDHSVIFSYKGMAGLSWQELFSSGSTRFFRPVGHLPMKLSYHLFAFDPRGYHLVNILLLSAVATAFWLLLTDLGVRKKVVLPALAYYLAHPFQGNAFNYITMSHVLVYVLLTTVSVYCFIGHFLYRRAWLYWMGLAAFAGSVLSHEMAVLTPVVLLVWAMAYRRLDRVFTMRLVPWVAALLIFLIVRKLDQSFHYAFNNPGEQIFRHFNHWVSAWFDLLGWYARQLLWPDRVLFLWSEPGSSSQWVLKFLALAAAGGGFVYWFFTSRRSAPVRFLSAVFLLGLLVSGWAGYLYPQVWPFIEPQWFYFTAIGYYVFVGWCCVQAAGQSRLIGAVLVSALFVLILGMSVRNNLSYKNEEVHSRHWLSINKGSAAPYRGLIRALADQGDCRGAVMVDHERRYYLSIQDPAVFSRMAYCYAKLGRPDLGEMFFQQVVSLGYVEADDICFLGRYFSASGDERTAARFFEQFKRMKLRQPGRQQEFCRY